jgi:hypothetical protein
MRMIEGVAYGPCGFCDHWYPVEEQSWSYDLPCQPEAGRGKQVNY